MPRKKENLWDLLTRLDQEAGQFNQTISGANRYFDMAASGTKKVLARQEKQLHRTISKVRQALKKFRSDTSKKNQ